MFKLMMNIFHCWHSLGTHMAGHINWLKVVPGKDYWMTPEKKKELQVPGSCCRLLP